MSLLIYCANGSLFAKGQEKHVTQNSVKFLLVNTYHFLFAFFSLTNDHEDFVRNNDNWLKFNCSVEI